VLLVEDEPTIAVTLADDLVDSGLRVTSVADGRSAVHLLEGLRFDAVITDLRLPGVDGLEVARAARRANPTTKVLLISACLLVHPGFRVDVQQTLAKPFHNHEVIDWLRSVGVMGARP